MNTIKFCITIGSLLFLLAGCTKEEETLTSSGIDEPGFFIPQGNRDFDRRIVDYYNRYGTYLLYKFSSKDAYWSVTRWDSSYRLVEADPEFIGNQLDLIDSTFFRYYDDSTLRKYLPRKFLLCSSIRFNNSGPQLDGYLSITQTTGWVYETFVANWGSSRILNIRGAIDSAARFRGNINYGFLRLLDLNRKVSISPVFNSISDYSTPIITTMQSQRYKRGFLTTLNSTIPPSPQTDWYSYIQAIVQNNYNFLTDANGLAPNDNTFRGILTPVKDSSGLIRRKYDEVVNYYKSTLNVDLQRIGNGDQ